VRSACFHILILALIAANLANFILNVERPQHARAHPVSSVSVKYVDPSSVPQLGFVMWERNTFAQINPADFYCWMYNSSYIGIQQCTLGPLIDGSYSSILPFFSVDEGQGWLSSTVHVQGSVRPGCYSVTLCVASDEDCFETGDLESAFVVCLSSASEDSNLTVQVVAALAYAATESLSGDVTYSVSLPQTSIFTDTSTKSPGVPIAIEWDAVLDENLMVPVSWIEYSVVYSILDLLSSIFAVFTMSLAVLAWIFPWEESNERRRLFMLDWSRFDRNMMEDSSNSYPLLEQRHEAALHDTV
jgi:hypothetical protein